MAQIIDFLETSEIHRCFVSFQSVNGGLVMVSFDSAHLSCDDKASMYDIIGMRASNFLSY